MATEEQTTGISDSGLYGAPGVNRGGQKLTISSRVVSKLSFKLAKYGSPTGTLYFRIRKVSDDSVLCSKGIDISTLPVYPNLDWTEATFDTPTFINEEVRICAEYTGGNVLNSGSFMYSSSDVKASENFWQYVYSWGDMAPRDMVYIYTYETIPTVTNQAVTDIASETLTGNGTITNLGSAAVTAHGHCWATTANPTIVADSSVDNGAAPNLGQFSSNITGLTPGETYYIRAYATNTYGTGYSDDVTNIQGTTIGRKHWWVEKDEFHWWDEYGVEQKRKGVAVAHGSDILKYLYM